MALAQLILDYVRVLIWPVVALVAFLTVRHHVGGIVSRMTSGEVDAMGVKFRLQLREAQVTAEAEKQAIDQTDDEPSKDLMMDEFNKFFDDVFEPFADLPEPRAAVVRAYLALISTVEKSADMLGLKATRDEANENGGSFRVEVPRLRRAGVVDKRLNEALRALDAGYEGVWRGQDIDSEDVALNYVNVAANTAQVIAANTIKLLRRQSSGETHRASQAEVRA